jgi:hypothetical protein
LFVLLSFIYFFGAHATCTVECAVAASFVNSLVLPVLSIFIRVELDEKYILSRTYWTMLLPRSWYMYCLRACMQHAEQDVSK